MYGDYWSVVLLDRLLAQSEGGNEWNIKPLFYSHRSLVVIGSQQSVETMNYIL